MGQAFDRDGRVLGEAEGDTKREVFEKLNNEFRNAHEIHIKTIEERMRGGDSPLNPTLNQPKPLNDPLLRAFGAYARTLRAGGGETWAAFEAGWRARDAMEHTQPAE